MRMFSVNSANDGLHEVLSCLIEHADSPNYVSPSRVGDVVDVGLVCIELSANAERLVSCFARAINPFFAIVEAAWVLAGKNDLAPLQFCLKDYGKFSDDGMTLHGAYGNRLRKWHGIDQIESAIGVLRNDPFSRRVAMVISDAKDSEFTGKDIPCNVMLLPRIRNQTLELTILNRSNDAYFGVPYNIFVFGCVQAYMASKLGVEIGKQIHVSNSMHLYLSNRVSALQVIRDRAARSEYIDGMSSRELIAWIIEDYSAIADLDFDRVTNESLRQFLLKYEESKKSGLAPKFDERGGYLDRLAFNWIRKTQQSSVAVLGR